MIHLMLKHITYKNSLSKVITKSFHPNDNTSSIFQLLFILLILQMTKKSLIMWKFLCSKKYEKYI